MKSKTTTILFMMMLSLLTMAAAQIIKEPVIPPDIIRLYPRVDVTPKAPAAGEKVSMRLVLGMHNNGCVPTYKDVSHKIEMSPILIYPPQYTITVKYTEVPPNPAVQFCIQVPTEYGPGFELGDLSMGTYSVVDGGKQAGRFNVAAAGPSKKADISGVITEDVRPAKMIKYLQGVKVYLQKSGPMLLKPDADVSALAPMPMFFTIDSAVTDKNGGYSISAELGGPYRLSLVKKGYQPKTIPYSMYGWGSFTLFADTVLNASLLPTGASSNVTGKVSTMDCPETGKAPCITKPCAACSVSVSLPLILYPPMYQIDAPIRPFPAYTAVTDKEGRYSIADIPITYSNQPVTATASAEGYASASKQKELLPMMGATINFTLKKAFTNSTTVISDGVSFTVATEKNQYTQGEGVLVRYTVTNSSASAVTWDFNSGCQFNMRADGPKAELIYLYSDNIGCTDNLTSLSLKPGQSESMEFPKFYVNGKSRIVTVSAWLRGYKKTTVASVKLNFTSATPISKLLPSQAQSADHISFSGATGELILNLDKRQDISLRTFTLDGRTAVPVFLNRDFAAGSHRIKLDNTGITGRVFVLLVKGERFIWKKTVTRAME